MIIGYLTNLYPKPTHSFIRREILAVEALGHTVLRYSIRPGGDEVDEADLAERARTRVILQSGAVALVVATLGAAVRAPWRFGAAAWLAVRVGWRSSVGVPRHLVYLAEACLLARWCRKDRVQHVHAHFGSNPATVAMLLNVLGGPTYSFTAHGIESFDAPESVALGEKVARAAFAVGVSQFGRSQLCRWSDPIAWTRIHVVRCGVDRQYLEHAPWPVPAAARLVCVARLSPEKGHMTLLHAAAHLAKSGRTFELVLVGDGPLRPAIESTIDRLGIGDRVRFAGWRSGAGVIEEILASRALVLPSFSEGLPVVLMEALALGRPCIATNITGIPELIVPGETGWLVPASSDDALAAAMAAALDAPTSDLDRMGRQGARRVVALHDVGTSGARMAALFREAIVRAGGSAD